jgi:hypothetical protein
MMQVMLERPSLPRSDEGPSAGPHTATVREPAGIYSELAVRMSASIWPRSSNALSGGRRVVAQAQRSRHEPDRRRLPAPPCRSPGGLLVRSSRHRSRLSIGRFRLRDDPRSLWRGVHGHGHLGTKRNRGRSPLTKARDTLALPLGQRLHRPGGPHSRSATARKQRSPSHHRAHSGRVDRPSR